MNLWLAIDALEYAYVEEHLQQLPTLREMTKKSLWGKCIPEVARCPESWATIFTGLPASEHGVNSLNKSIVCDPPYPALWQMVDNAGLSVGVYRIPCTYPPEHLKKGWFFSGWTSPGQACWPNNETFYPYMAECLSVEGQDVLLRTSYVANLAASSFTQGIEAVKKLLVKHPVDLAIIGIDVLQLLYTHAWEWQWDAMEEDRLNWHRRVDAAISTIVKLCQPKATIITSDHGMKDPGAFYYFSAKGEEKTINMVDTLPTALRILGMQCSLSMPGVAQL